VNTSLVRGWSITLEGNKSGNGHAHCSRALSGLIVLRLVAVRNDAAALQWSRSGKKPFLPFTIAAASPLVGGVAAGYLTTVIKCRLQHCD